MKRRIGLSAFLVMALFFCVSGCRAKKTEEVEPGAQNDETPSAITLSESALKIAGIEVEKAGLRKVSLKICCAAEMAFNQKRLMNLTSRAAGRVEEISAFVGDRVKEGQPLLALYSPDFLTSQAEFLQLEERLKRVTKDNLQDEILTAKSLLDSARRKLILLGLNDAELKELEETRQVKPVLPVRAPFSGNIIESPIVRGDQIPEGATVFRIADLSLLWVKVHIFEKDLSRIQLGMPALVRVQAYPDQAFQGTLTLLNDVVDEKTRTVIGRVEVLNSRSLLKPGMYAEVELILPSSAAALLVPEAAVQDLEGKKVVFMPASGRSFRFQEVEVGQKLNGWVEVVKGLSAGDAYVRDGFLLKSEVLKKNLEVD